MNIFHCCVQKTASQWIASIFRKSKILESSDLKAFDYYKEVMQQQEQLVAPPPNTLLTPIYASYEEFQKIPKPDDYRAFVVIRDPRDIVVSWYFSAALTHGVKHSEMLQALRKDLGSMSFQDGLMLSIEQLNYLFNSLRSWRQSEETDPRIKIFKFEDLTQANRFVVFKELLQHCKISVSDTVLHDVLNQYSFEKLTKRRTGEEDLSSHLRKGMAGDWVNYFNRAVSHKFAEAAGDLPAMLGYQDTKDAFITRQYELADQRLEDRDRHIVQPLDKEPPQAWQNDQVVLKPGSVLHLVQTDLETIKSDVLSLKGESRLIREALGEPKYQHKGLEESLKRAQQAITETNSKIASLESENRGLFKALQASDQKLQAVREKRDALRAGLKNKIEDVKRKNRQNSFYRNEIEAMKTSKFWKLRSFWLKIKQALKLK